MIYRIYPYNSTMLRTTFAWMGNIGAILVISQIFTSPPIRTGASPASMVPLKSVQMHSAGKENDMLAPLLPELRQPAAKQLGGASISGVVFNLSTTIIGAGIMSLPAATKVLGVGPALLLIAAVAFLSNVSAQFLLRYTVPGSPCSYAGVMGESFGRVGSTSLQLCVALLTMGTLTIFLIIIGRSTLVSMCVQIRADIIDGSLL